MSIRDLLGIGTAEKIRSIGQEMADTFRQQRLDMAENEVRILRANLPRRLRNKSLLELARRRNVALTGQAREAADRLHKDFDL